MRFITHPNNIDTIKNIIIKDYSIPNNDDGVHIPRKDFLFGIDIIADSELKETELVPTGIFIRNNSHSLKDNKYFDWVTQDDIDNKTEWMCKIGLLVEVFESRPVYYCIQNPIVFNGNTMQPFAPLRFSKRCSR